MTQGDERLTGYFGLTLPVWSVYTLGVLAIVAGLSIPVILRWTGWLQGQVPSSEVQPGRDVRPVMVRLPGGTFRMGSPDEEDFHQDDETVHWVQISPFEMCQSEVTQENWRAVMDRNPSDCQYGCGDKLPVHDVSWHDAIAYLNALTELENRTRRTSGEPEMSVCYTREGDEVVWQRGCTGYRLPTEAEWEYAARARSVTAYEFGDDAARLGEFAWYVDNSGAKVHAVGSADNPESNQPNAWGLYDMHGNVWEWVWDWYGSYDKSQFEKPLVNPRGPDKEKAADVDVPDFDEQGTWKKVNGERQWVEGKARVLRGGGFRDWAGVLRSADRVGFGPTDRDWGNGFRCARDVPPALSH